MHFFARPQKGIVRPIVTLLTIVGAILVTVVSYNAPVAHAASISGTNEYHGTPGTITRLSTSQPSLNAAPAHGKHVVPLRSLARTGINATATTQFRGPVLSDTKLGSEGKVLHNFNGISDADQAAVNGGVGAGEVTPPDQGLCVGFDPGVPGTPVVFEAVNSALRETSLDGKPLPGAPLLHNHDVSFAGFWEPGAFSDPRCFYDKATHSFYFTVIGFLQSGPDVGNTSIDIAVFNAKGFKVYQIDSSAGGTQFGDQPHVGYDNNNLYASTDQFDVAGTVYFGADLFVVSKAQLVAEVATPSVTAFGPVSLGGIPIITLEPAISTTSTNTEYLVNSFPFSDADITPNAVSRQLGLWTFKNGTLSGKIITSELYAFPVNAVSTGTGLTNNGITSESFLTPNDSRLLQVQFINGHLWAALTSAVSVGKDPVVRDGVAWFNIDAKKGSIASQGYIASAGNYLIFPAIFKTDEGTAAVTFTITSAKLNPSAGYAVMKSDAQNFGSVHIAALGSSPHLSFADTIPVFGRPRWGDYSAATLGPDNNIWLATEYIPSPADQDAFDNWGTRVFSVVSDH